MATSSNLGFPRIGYHRQLKLATEKYWSKQLSAEQLLETGRTIRAKNWQMQKEAGISHIPSNDFSFYDHILDAAIIFGAVPKNYVEEISSSERDRVLELYFNLARGRAEDNAAGHEAAPLTALEMTKWFDTNYHYIVPELEANQQFKLSSRKPVDEFLEAKALGIHTRPVIIGPVSFLKLAKMKDAQTNRWTLLPRLLKIYNSLFDLLKTAGADWIQIDEPCLVLDLDDETKKAYKTTYETLSKYGLKLLLTTYFGSLGDNLELALSLPAAGIHLDFTGEHNNTVDQDPADKDRRAADLLLRYKLPKDWPKNKLLSAGIIDGRNIWACDLYHTLEKLRQLAKLVGHDNLIVAPSCSLLHVPIDLNEETHLDKEILSWLAFAKQKLTEISALTEALNNNTAAVSKQFDANKQAIADHRASTRVHNQALKSQLVNLPAELFKRKNPFAIRKALQQKQLNLPLLPTTTIGSFPQTKEIRKARADYKAGKINKEEYKLAMQAEIKNAIDVQNDIGLDVLVHGEAERNDMVEYFAEFLEGYIFTAQGWVQSYGSRCVKPPIIFGDIIRKQPMTLEWSVFAQQHANQAATKKPMKGMLTGPVTMLQWSFVRSDQPRSETCKQLAWAIREEVLDLEQNGIKVIQIDEPAIREGLPLKRAAWQDYLNWAVNCFRLVSSSVKDETQIHTHMCYSEFNDIIDSVAALDADVVSIEAARSKLELLDSFVKFKYPNDIGPGVFDIHSPRVPSESEMIELLEKALAVIDPGQLWVNPDCGLKTRGWTEVIPALRNMVASAKSLRSQIKTKEPAKTV